MIDSKLNFPVHSINGYPRDGILTIGTSIIFDLLCNFYKLYSVFTGTECSSDVNEVVQSAIAKTKRHNRIMVEEIPSILV